MKRGIRKHLLLTEELKKQIPALYTQEDKKDEAIVYAKFFTPDSNWTWLVLEYDPEQRIFFGLVKGLEIEYGYFSLDELESLRGPLGLPVERDLGFTKRTLREAKISENIRI